MNLHEQKQSAKQKMAAKLSQYSLLQKLANTGDFELYARPLNVAAATERTHQFQKLSEKYGLGSVEADVALLALRVLDKEGQPYFDANNPEDIELLKSLPNALINDWFDQINQIESIQAALKKLSTTEKSP